MVVETSAVTTITRRNGPACRSLERQTPQNEIKAERAIALAETKLSALNFSPQPSSSSRRRSATRFGRTWARSCRRSGSRGSIPVPGWSRATWLHYRRVPPGRRRHRPCHRPWTRVDLIEDRSSITSSISRIHTDHSSNMPSFGLGDIKRTIPGAAFARAESYVRQGRVRGVGPGEEARSLIGHVQGTERQPYEQHIRIIGDGRDRRIISWCSCPVGANCKHVGAVLLTALDQPRAGPRDVGDVGIAPELAAWLDELEAASAPEPSNDFPPEIRQRLIYVLDLGKPWQTPPRLSLSLYSARVLKDGRFGAAPRSYSASNAFNQPAAKFLRPIDLGILQELCRQRSLDQWYRRRLPPRRRDRRSAAPANS